MNHEKLFDLLESYGKISEREKDAIKKYFIPLEVKKNEVLVTKNFPCKKLFFINKGYLRAFYSNEQDK